jgi:hypothetical protein
VHRRYLGRRTRTGVLRATTGVASRGLSAAIRSAWKRLRRRAAIPDRCQVAAPRPGIVEFEGNLKKCMAGPPVAEQLTVIGSYRLF